MLGLSDVLAFDEFAFDLVSQALLA
nr:putative integron gene cassette protein [uncultured bacterium]